MCLNLSLYYKVGSSYCTLQKVSETQFWLVEEISPQRVIMSVWHFGETRRDSVYNDNTTCLIPWCMMVQALALGGMYVMCKQKVNEGEKCFSIQPLTKFHFTDCQYTAIYTVHLNDEWERPQVWLATETPFVKFRSHSIPHISTIYAKFMIIIFFQIFI